MKTRLFALRAGLIVLASLVLSSCSEDLDIREGLYNGFDDDYISVDFLVPDLEVVSTRATEDEVNTLTLFLFDKDSKKLVQKVDINSNDQNLSKKENSNEYSCKIEKGPDAKAANHLVIYAFANASSEFISTSGANIDALMQEVSSNYKSEDGFYMSGKADVTSSTVINLVRNAGKLTLGYKKDENNNQIVTNFTIKNLYLYNPASEAFLTVGITNNFSGNYKKGSDADVRPEHFIGLEPDSNYTLYSLPTKTHDVEGETADILTYIVVEGIYKDDDSYKNGKNTFYALPLYSRSKHEHYNILPNHWYDILIEEVNHIGSDDLIAAVKNPCDYIIYEIHDHTQTIFSMASDGTHELGVTRIVDMKRTENGPYTGTFIVKWYSADPRDREPNFDFVRDIKVEITEGKDWLALGDKVQIEDKSETEDNFGTQYEYTVSLKEDRYTPQEAKLLVIWNDSKTNTQAKLKREIIVRYNPDFIVQETCDVSLTIKDENGTVKYKINDYWKFIQGGDTQYPLYGVDASVMVDGKARDEGFHFPMPYGESNPWTYEYVIDFSDLLGKMKEQGMGDNITITNITKSTSVNYPYFKANDTDKTSWEYPYEGDNNKVRITLNPDQKSDYTYAAGKIIFTITYRIGEETQTHTRSETMDIYHTGFFHFDDKYTSDPGFYYYEVIEMEGKYWLDRNLGAKSNLMFVDDGSSSGLGHSEARGNFLKVADGAQYASPKLSLDMCPPGYHIPVGSEWNTIRLSDRFRTSVETDNLTTPSSTYTATYYNSSVGKVYFPRAKYYNSSTDETDLVQTTANMGDASTGYYWTHTDADGMEKEQMGKWLRGLYLNGSTSTYMNFDIRKSKLLVRCIAGAETPHQDNNYVSFNVHEVTHVYLFDTQTGKPLYTFPGKAVSSSASSDQWQYFSCTTSVPSSELGVLFVQMNSSGQLKLYTKNGNKFNIIDREFSKVIDEEALKKEALKQENKNYWALSDKDNGKPIYYYDFCEKALKGDQRAIATNEKPKIANPDDPDEDFECNAAPEVITGGGNQGDGNQGDFDYDSLKGDKIWTPNYTIGDNQGWQQLAYGQYNWNEVPVDSSLKLYYTKGSGQMKLRFAIGSSWDTCLVPEVFDPTQNPFEVTLSSSILQQIRNGQGLIIFGSNYTIKAVTIEFKK